jgi:hypothetical protein
MHTSMRLVTSHLLVVSNINASCTNFVRELTDSLRNVGGHLYVQSTNSLSWQICPC